MNGAVVLDGRLGPDGKPVTTDNLVWNHVKEGDNNEKVDEGIDVDKAKKLGVTKDEAVKAGFGEKDIVEKGLEHNSTIK